MANDRFNPTPLEEILSPRPYNARKRVKWRGRPGEITPLWAILGDEPPDEPAIDWQLQQEEMAHRQNSVALVQLAQAASGGDKPTPSDALTLPGPVSGTGQPTEGAPQTDVHHRQSFLPGGKLDWPTDYPRVNSRFGKRKRNGVQRVHNGVDARAYEGSPIRAVDNGVVIDTEPSPSGGNQIRIQHDDGYVSGYAHTGPAVIPGQRVRRGDVIGHSDGSGGVAPHLHFTYRPGLDAPRVDPYPFLPQVPVDP